MTEASAPGPRRERIESLDVIRGFAVLGILLVNIIAFGLHSSALFDPASDVDPSTANANLIAWASVEVFAEGAMRALFSMLFGASLLVFVSPGNRGGLHYRRTFWLLVFGLFDAVLLVWAGDVLVVYAIAGALLYPLRNLRARWLLASAGVLLVAMSLQYAGTGYGLGHAREIAAAGGANANDPELRAAARAWSDFADDFLQTAADIEQELSERRAGYVTALRWNLGELAGMYAFVVPVILLWDALAMMLLGMALFRLGVLQAARSTRFYRNLALVALPLGVLLNAAEVGGAIASGLDLLAVFGQAQPGYHVGRLLLALGYLALLVLLVRTASWPGLRHALGCAGRMALTNYLAHSLICLLLFTGAGLGLVGELARWQLYPVVLIIWVAQLAFSVMWLSRYRFGPAEWLWRGLTYGRSPTLAVPASAESRHG